ncbi:NAD(P)-dependent oxidoreductase [bacterium]|nr:NAD(P)-dependent oxidoreductase [bacterium]
MKIIVITGATSFIGLHLLQTWLQEDCLICAVVRKGSKKIDLLPKNDKLQCLELNMDEYDKLPQLISQADYFYHLAWEGTRAPLRDNAEMQQHNYECSLKAFRVAVKLGCQYFVGSGSQAEYGKMDGIVTENSACNPSTEYGIYKLKTCEMLGNLAQKEQIHFIWTRIFSLYGPHDDPRTLISSCIKKMLNNEESPMTQCSQLWDFLYVGDAALAMKHLVLQKCESGVYNLASGKILPLKDFVIKLKDILGSSSELRFGAIPYGPSGPVDLKPDVRKILQTGWSAQTDFKEGILKTVKGSVEL